MWRLITVSSIWFCIGALTAYQILLPAKTAAPALPSAEPMSASSVAPVVAFNQSFIQQLSADHNLDLSDPLAVFAAVFKALPSDVDVLPTENYFYWSFYQAGRSIWGNIRFEATRKDPLRVSFGYFIKHNYPQKRSDLKQGSRVSYLGADDNLQIKQPDPFTYILRFKGKQVRFRLNSISQEPPAQIPLLDSEEFMERTLDESGWQFLVVFDSEQRQFRFIVDSSVAHPDQLITVKESLLLGRLSGFSFYRDTNNRLILIGVDSTNIRRNNYYDGPFDQLADNFVDSDKRKARIEEAYPSVRGRIDKLGIFVDSTGRQLTRRVAITPYYSYSSVGALMRFFDSCKKNKSEHSLIGCLTADHKQKRGRSPLLNKID